MTTTAAPQLTGIDLIETKEERGVGQYTCNDPEAACRLVKRYFDACMSGVEVAEDGCTHPVKQKDVDRLFDAARGAVLAVLAKAPKQCSACRDGEHDNFDDDTRRVTVRDPDTGNRISCAWMCAKHRSIYLDAGSDLHVKGVVP
jgi:hypothetical protein